MGIGVFECKRLNLQERISQKYTFRKKIYTLTGTMIELDDSALAH